MALPPSPAEITPGAGDRYAPQPPPPTEPLPPAVSQVPGLAAVGNRYVPPPKGTPMPPPVQGTADAFTSAEQDAWSVLIQTLQAYGFSGQDLTSLGNFVKQELINGTGSDQITLDLEQTPEFAKRFPAIVERRDQGLPAISPSEYVSLETSYEQLERAAGLPPNFASYDQLIANDVSPTEYADRINQGYLVVAQGDPTVRQAFQDYYGVTPGQLAGYFLDPTKSEPMLQQQAVAAQIGGASAQSGFGQVTQPQAQRLAQMNVNFSTAQQGFQQLAHQAQLYTNLPGQGTQQEPTQDQLLNAQFGSDATTKDFLALQASKEKGYFEQGGKAAETSSGLTGLGQLRE